MNEDRQIGVVCWFNQRTGIGFITPDEGDNDYFVHYSNIVCDGFKTLREGQKVSFKLGENHRGVQAIDVEVEDKGE